MDISLPKVNYDLIQAGPVGSLDAYIQGVGIIPVLSKEAEQTLAHKYNNEEDLQAALSRTEAFAALSNLAQFSQIASFAFVSPRPEPFGNIERVILLF